METQVVIALVIGIVVMFFVPALVWHRVIAGLIQIAREKTQESLNATIAYSEHNPQEL
jgi:uncharacterized membrane protein